MNALLVNVTINDRGPALAVLREQIVPRASQALESAEAAQALARVIESNGPPSDAVALDGLEVHEVVAHA
jgi:hypothetical protein